MRAISSVAVAALTVGVLATGPAGPASADDTPDTRAVQDTGGGEPSAQATVRPSLVLDHDFPDPDVSKFGDTYYAYATNEGKNLPWATAPDPNGPWTYQSTGAWAQEGRTWAPDVSRRADGRYLL